MNITTNIMEPSLPSMMNGMLTLEAGGTLLQNRSENIKYCHDKDFMAPNSNNS